jgi:hypothetical protein
MKKIPVVNVENAKARKVRMIVKGSGSGAKCAKCAKEPVGGRESRAKLIIAPSVRCGVRLADMLGLPPNEVAIVTDPTYLDNVVIYPKEEIFMVMGSDGGFIEQLQTAATMFVPGESFYIKMYAL